MNNKLPLVVIFGRTNVGKSTIFNCLTERRQAMVADIEGTTRDSNIGSVSWCGTDFELVDTGGIIDLEYLTDKKKKTDDIEAKVQKQARSYLVKADLVLFIVDSKAGLLPHDREMAVIMKKILPDTFKKKVVLVVNKVDSHKQRERAAEFFKLAMGEPYIISAATGSGTGDLLDMVVARVGEPKETKHPLDGGQYDEPEEIEEDFVVEEGAELEPIEIVAPVAGEVKPIRISIMGKPNVGKSSLLNAILGYERVIVSPVAHTTREPQDTDIVYNDIPVKLIDTAGITKRGQQSTKRTIKGIAYLEKHGIVKSLSTLRKVDIVLFVLDISQEITHQDAQIIQELVQSRKSIIIIANKWDLIPEKDTVRYTQYIRAKLPFINWAPIQFTSAFTGEKVNKILDLSVEVGVGRQARFESSTLNTFLMKIIKIHKPSKAKGVKHPYIYKFDQVHSNPPRFEMRIGAKDNIHFSYVRFVENRIRERFGFHGTPISIEVTHNRPIHGKQERPADGRPKRPKGQSQRPRTKRR
jgi:GTPase